MKSLFVILLAIVATESRQVCIPNTQFKQDCNTCFCTADGSAISCTIMICDPNTRIKPNTMKIAKGSFLTRQSVHDKKCEPGTSVKYYCNSCTCNKLGKVGRCTKMYCDENLYNEDGTYKTDRQDKECEPGKVYKRDSCNTCICNEHGTETLCTNKSCVSNLIGTLTDKETKKWGPLYKQGYSCTPGQSFYSECNQCVCSRNGKSAFCTLVTC